MNPRVSICLPTLNSLRFLAERLESIRQQTLSDWELIVFDSYSEDGTFELLQKFAREDTRIQLHQAARDGIYTNINRCIAVARGQYVYIATSDDTMAQNCLEKMVKVLDLCPLCDLAHCRLKLIDENGNTPSDNWWSSVSTFALSSGDLYSNRIHIRKAPFDGLLHIIGATVYTSLTQLLIRRSLFDKVGLFEPRWGSIGDFNWTMRAALLANTVHVTHTWAGWRVHSAQATASAGLGSVEYRAKIDQMIEHAVNSCEASLTPKVRNELRSRWLPRAKDMREFFADLARFKRPLARRAYIARRLIAGSWTARQHIRSRLSHIEGLPRSAPKVILKWLEAAGVTPVLILLEVADNLQDFFI